VGTSFSTLRKKEKKKPGTGHVKISKKKRKRGGLWGSKEGTLDVRTARGQEMEQRGEHERTSHVGRALRGGG